MITAFSRLRLLGLNLKIGKRQEGPSRPLNMCLNPPGWDLSIENPNAQPEYILLYLTKFVKLFGILFSIFSNYGINTKFKEKIKIGW